MGCSSTCPIRTPRARGEEGQDGLKTAMIVISPSIISTVMTNRNSLARASSTHGDSEERGEQEVGRPEHRVVVKTSTAAAASVLTTVQTSGGSSGPCQPPRKSGTANAATV
jgi:hypothetical protein